MHRKMGACRSSGEYSTKRIQHTIITATQTHSLRQTHTRAHTTPSKPSVIQNQTGVDDEKRKATGGSARARTVFFYSALIRMFAAMLSLRHVDTSRLSGGSMRELVLRCDTRQQTRSDDDEKNTHTHSPCSQPNTEATQRNTHAVPTH